MHEYQATIRNRGQVTIPAAIRRLLGLSSGAKVIFEVDQAGRVILRPATFDLASAYASVPPIERPEDFKTISREAREDRADDTLVRQKTCWGHIE